MLSVNTIDDILKSFYLDVVAKQINCGASPLYDMIEKSSVNVDGKNAIIPVYFGMSGGLMTTNDDGTDLPNANPCLRETLQVPLRNVYGVIDITDKALRLCKDNAEGVVNVLGTEIQAMINSARQSLNRMLWTTGNGQLGIVGDNTGIVSRVIVPVDSVAQFTPGMMIDVYRGQEKIHEALRVAEVAHDDCRVILTAPIRTENPLQEGDIIFAHRSRATELHGIPYLFSDDDNYYFGANKTSNPAMGGTNRDLGDSISTEAMQDFLDLIETRSDTTPDLIVCDKLVRRQYINYLQANRTNIDYLNLDGGFRTLSYNGIPLYGEKYCPNNHMYFLSTDNIKMVQLCDWEWLEGNNGTILNRLDNKAAYQAVLVKYANYVATVPNSIGRLYNIC
ncbi:MAG: phage major capsid protein [Clostridia bacterium]|nr:phage major capsid protein [Clostridia bacterium]